MDAKVGVKPTQAKSGDQNTTNHLHNLNCYRKFSVKKWLS